MMMIKKADIIKEDGDKKSNNNDKKSENIENKMSDDIDNDSDRPKTPKSVNNNIII